MRELTYKEAINEALREEITKDENVFLIGEDIGIHGGAFKVTQGLIEQFGPEKVMDTPISEAALVGAAVGVAATGMRPVAEIMFNDFITIGMDQIVNQAAKMRYMFGGKLKVPMVVRTQGGGGVCAAAQHSQSLEAWFFHIPGLKVVMPSTPYDAKGLLKSAIRDDNPVIFLEHKLLYGVRGDVPEEEYEIPLGKADIKREGKDVTVVATSMMVHKALKAAEKLQKEGISVEVIDPRSLVPMDYDTIIESVKKTERVVIANEACKRGSISGEIASVIVEKAFDYLDAPIVRVGAKEYPIPFSGILEQEILPGEKDIIEAVKSIV
jgi:pyruvate/2-oxoglutarate/acetoin dehydrogenase E1 component